jgi:HD-GYP domain-containing protein (c-di-GMP phosphodiesterase class II)
VKLKKDLKSIDNKLLVKAGEEINKAVLRRIARSAGNIYYIRIKDTIVAKHFKRAFKDERYKIILSPESANEKVLSIIEKTTLPKKIIAELLNIKKKMPYTYHHILMITILGTKLILDKNLKKLYKPEKMVRLGIIHDIGKSRIPPEILDKPTPLTLEEYETIKLHPLIGYVLLHYYYGKAHSNYDYTSYEHHERLDGSGYPRKIKTIHSYSQAVAVVDVLDALISSRPYRKAAYTLRAALDFLALDELKKRRLNKKIVYLLVSYSRKNKPELKDLKISKIKRDKPPAENVYGKIAPQIRGHNT